MISIAKSTTGPLGPDYHVRITLIASYADSERMAVKIKVEQSDNTFKEYTRDLPIVIENKTPQATVDLVFLGSPVGVPTIEATERGGAIKAKHVYN